MAHSRPLAADRSPLRSSTAADWVVARRWAAQPLLAESSLAAGLTW